MADRAERRRLILQLERDSVTQQQLRALLAASDSAVAASRRDLRSLKARMARRSAGQERNT
jgi:hypothetical protein